MRKEIELKFQLQSRQHADRVYNHFSQQSSQQGGSCVEQVNHFFDTVDLELRARKTVMRMRRTNNQFVLAAKNKIISLIHAPALSIKYEEELRLSDKEGRAILSGKMCPLFKMEEYLKGLNRGTGIYIDGLRQFSGKLRHLGSFSTVRRTVPVWLASRPLNLEIDESTFSDGRRIFQVEIELEEPSHASSVQAAFLAQMTRLNVKVPKPIGKAKTFFEILRGAA